MELLMEHKGGNFTQLTFDPQYIVEANIVYLPTKLGNKQAYGWKVNNRLKTI